MMGQTMTITGPAEKCAGWMYLGHVVGSSLVHHSNRGVVIGDTSGLPGVVLSHRATIDQYIKPVSTRLAYC